MKKTKIENTTRKAKKPEQLRLRKRTIVVLNDDQVGDVAGAGSNISCDGGDCVGPTRNVTDCWPTCNTCDPTCGYTCEDCPPPTHTCCNC